MPLTVKFVSIILQTLLLASFAMWFGGFGFYVSFVVPVGNEILGSSFEQGMVTRQVTVPLNYLSGIAAACMVCDAIFRWKKAGNRCRYGLLGFSVTMILMLAALLYLHPQIDGFVDQESRDIAGDYDQFYWLHRLYLWASTVQWFAAWGWLVCYVASRKTGLPSKDVD
jgi:hypothetical protein